MQAPLKAKSLKRNHRRLPTVRENLQRLVAEMVRAIPNEGLADVWPYTQVSPIPLRRRTQEPRKIFGVPRGILPSYCEELQHDVASGPGKRKKLYIPKRLSIFTNLKNVTLKDAVKIFTSHRSNPYLDSIWDREIALETRPLGNGKKWLSLPVHVIGNNGLFKDKNGKSSDVTGKK